ncbi:MAG TPA: hypothetical protein VKB50_14310, partial [Vicinamibacterales bacterium]|nr:hypothetical protein [Vicinamibacterales bacterium]
PSAQRRRGNDNTAQGAPVATNTILQAPDVFYGKVVTVSAGIEQVLSKTAFIVDQRKAVGATGVKPIGAPLLVIAPYLNASLDPKHYLTVRGQVVRFDPAAITRVAPDYTLDVPADAGSKFQGQPVLVATAVIDASFTDLAKKPIPPPTPTDVSLSVAMKAINPAFTAIRTAAQESKADVVAENAAKLKLAFAEAAAIFDASKNPAAARARDGITHITAIERAAVAGDWEGAKGSAALLNQLCQNCHAAYRERQDDGTFRLKEGSF